MTEGTNPTGPRAPHGGPTRSFTEDLRSIIIDEEATEENLDPPRPRRSFGLPPIRPPAPPTPPDVKPPDTPEKPDGTADAPAP